MINSYNFAIIRQKNDFEKCGRVYLMFPYNVVVLLTLIHIMDSKTAEIDGAGFVAIKLR